MTLTKLTSSILCIFWLVICAPSLHAKPYPAQVTSAFVNVHSGPGIGYPIIQVVLKKESLTVIKKRPGWVQVGLANQQTGWIDEQELTNLISANGEQFVLEENRASEYAKRQFEMGVMLGDFNGNSYYQLSGSYLFDSQTQLELLIGQAQGEQSDSTLYEFTLALEPFPEWTISPYFGVGAGHLQTQAKSVLVQVDNEDNNLVSSEFGIRYYLTRRFVARLGYRYSVLTAENKNNQEIDTWKLGISVFY